MCIDHLTALKLFMGSATAKPAIRAGRRVSLRTCMFSAD